MDAAVQFTRLSSSNLVQPPYSVSSLMTSSHKQGLSTLFSTEGGKGWVMCIWMLSDTAACAVRHPGVLCDASFATRLLNGPDPQLLGCCCTSPIMCTMCMALWSWRALVV